jgi:NAD(P)-dependent dehydrogenase (short-subunit alcohol dehydrogenase family)
MTAQPRKIAIVGGTRGIGAAITGAFVAAGDDVLLTAARSQVLSKKPICLS